MRSLIDTGNMVQVGVRRLGRSRFLSHDGVLGLQDLLRLRGLELVELRGELRLSLMLGGLQALGQSLPQLGAKSFSLILLL